VSNNHNLLENVWHWEREKVHPQVGIIVLSETHHYDTFKQQVSSRSRYEQFDNNGNLIRVHLQTQELAYLYAGDIRDLLTETGFSSISILGGFDGKTFEPDDRELVVKAYKFNAGT